MQPNALPNQFDPAPRVTEITSKDRARLSGPGMRSFLNLADLWSLTEREKIALLGEPPRSTYHLWVKKARSGDKITLPLDTLLRLSGLLGVHKSLAILFTEFGQAMVWLKGTHTGTVFRGMAPLDVMVTGAGDGILLVRRYLDAWRGGELGHGALDFEPVLPEDIVFV